MTVRTGFPGTLREVVPDDLLPSPLRLPLPSQLRSRPTSPTAAGSQPGGPQEQAAAGAQPEAARAGALELDDVYRAHAALVSRWAERLAGPGPDLEDIVHDVFLVAHRRRREWRGAAKLSTWLYEITIRVVQARRRSRRRWRWLQLGQEDELALGPASVPVPTPCDLVEQTRSVALLYRLLDELDDKQRTALILFEIEGLSGDDIAKLTGTSVVNVWARVSRGREALARRLAAIQSGEAS